MSLIFATQLTAVATVALAVLALAAGIVAGIALSKQSSQLAILAEQNDRDIAERHQAQAAQVFTGAEDIRHRYAHPYAKNGSDFPVYDAQFWQAAPGVLSDPENIGMIPPGGAAVNGRQISYREALETTVLTFRDAAGARWIRMPDGTIKEQERGTARESLLAVFGGPLPVQAEAAATDEATGQSEEPGASGPQ
jgi:hypothetical protein